jgi:hypothetical protein
MKDSKSTIRYLGFKALQDGSRRFDFSLSRFDGSLQVVSVEAHRMLLSGPNPIALQECAAICYETLKSRVGSSGTLPSAMSLTSADVAQHRRPVKVAGRRPTA